MTGSADRARAADAASDGRAATFSRVFRMIPAVQDGVRLSAGGVRGLVADADARGWPEVAMIALVLDLVRAEVEGGVPEPGAIETLLRRATASGDLVMVAAALAVQARASIISETTPSVEADADLARASVLLESAPDPTKQSALAHIECARAYALRDLWELELEHYAAGDVQPFDADDEAVLKPALRINRAETQLTWLMGLRELGDTGELASRAAAAATAIERAQIPTMPSSRRVDVEIFGQLLASIAPQAAKPAWLAIDAPPEGPFAGYVSLARALRARDPADALLHAEKAVLAIDAVLKRTAHNLALCVRAEAEQALAGSETAGLTYARHLARLRWRGRETALASARALRRAERLRSEHHVLSQHVFLDDLTGLGNRRALAHHLESLGGRDGADRIAVVLIDIDRFKAVNDIHGHGAGDVTLVRVAEILRGAVRSGDLAVRLGGDEFMLLLADTALDVLRQRSNEIVAKVAAEPWDAVSRGLRVTASAGIATGAPRRYDAIAAAADGALYRAKAAGGNVVRLEHD